MGKHRTKTKIGECEYHLCKKKTKVFLCKYCGGYFCKEHIKPKPVLSLRQVSSTKEPLRSKLEEVWRSSKGHPDYVYTPIFWRQIEEIEERKTEKLLETLDELKKTGEVVKHKEEHKLEPEFFESPPLLTYTLETTERKSKNLGKNILIGICGILVIVILFWFLIKSSMTQSGSQEITIPIVVTKIEDICLSQVNECLEIARSKLPSETKLNVINTKKFMGGENITEWVQIYFLSPAWGGLTCESFWAENFLPCKDYTTLKNLSESLSSQQIVGIGVAIKKEAVEMGEYYSAVFPVFCDDNGNLMINSKNFLLTELK